MNRVKIGKEFFIPSKVVCVGRNYVEHIKELNNEIPENIVIFNKPNSAISNELKYFGNKCRFEGEISFLIKNSKIFGVGFGLDLTKVDIQNYLKSKGLPWERAKAFDSSAVFGEFVELKTNIENLKMELWINGELIQKASYELMIHKPNSILEEIKSFMSLEDGDIIMTGTPKGVGYYEIGDEFVGKIFDKDKLILESKFKVLKR